MFEPLECSNKVLITLQIHNKKYTVAFIAVGFVLLAISYTDIVVHVEEKGATDYALYTFWSGLSLISFGAGSLFTEKKFAIMLALALPVLISFFGIVLIFIIGVPIFPHFYDA